jgi:hypothetical protein
MIDKIDKGQIHEILANLASRQNRSTENLEKNSPDASLQIDYAALIKRATEIPQTDTAAIARARQLLSSGELESTDSYRKVAENIIELGI